VSPYKFWKVLHLYLKYEIDNIYAKYENSTTV
jgi:hypothetical protein